MKKTLDFTYTDIASFNDSLCAVSGASLMNLDVAWPQWLVDYHSFRGVSSAGEAPAVWTARYIPGAVYTRTITVNDKDHTNYIIQPDDVIVLLNDNTLHVMQCNQFIYLTTTALTTNTPSPWALTFDYTDDDSYWTGLSYAEEEDNEHTHLGWQLTTANRIDNSDWPEWLHRAWQKDSCDIDSVNPYPRGTGTGLVSINTSAGQRTVDWCDWIVYNTKTESLGVCSHQFYTEVLGGA